MKFTVIGWYGSETIGDRAILAGLLHLFSIIDNDGFILNYGSLFPQFTERTLMEDLDFYKDITNNRLKHVGIFYSLSVSDLKKNINDSDLLFIGGGPLMDLQQMFMLKFAFQYAKKRGIKTAVLGCGWGPLKEKKYEEIASYLIKDADASILRDNVSVSEFLSKSNHLDNKVPLGLVDPAVFTAQFYRNTHSAIDYDDYICINLRHLFVVDKSGQGKFTVADCCKIVMNILNHHPQSKIIFVPMHTFAIGGDDRIILNKIAQMIDSDRIIVENIPLSLKETMSLYYKASMSVGMRYHAILLQTVLNGRNYILDYMPSDKGKTSNFLKQLDLYKLYKDRYISCEDVKQIDFKGNIQTVVIPDSTIDNYKQQYIQSIKNVLLNS